MRTITHSDLRNGSAQILRDVEAGETMLITNRGKTVAAIGPPASISPDGLPVSRPATRRGFDPPPRALLPGEPSTQQVIDELRGGA